MTANQMTPRIRWYQILISISLSAAGTTACAAQGSSTVDRIECVGRLALTLPGRVDVAAMSPDQFMKNSEDRVFQFDDGEAAFYSNFEFGGIVAMTRPLKKNEVDGLLANQRAGFSGIKEAVSTGRMLASDSTELTVKKLNIADAACGWKLFNQNEMTYIAYPPVPGVGVSWTVSGTAEQGVKIEKDFRTFWKGARPRSTYLIPVEKGICMPHLFIPDGGDTSTNRLVAATYRLHAHPDITIMLKDASATGVSDDNVRNNRSAISKSNFFWTQDYQQAKSVRSLLNGSHNKVKLAGRRAVATMVRIERKDGSEDFGYLVVASGDAQAAVDTPDIMFYVIRNAENARKKDVAPLPKEEFFHLAQSIASTIKNRDAR